ncbi:MAG: hypothetical protein HRT68_02605 [Flavobacteriaceae bacterium]|nr:hypothetical protein [Flavobacteriaceae bacterium]
MDWKQPSSCINFQWFAFDYRAISLPMFTEFITQAFVLDKAKEQNDEAYYRLLDAKGGSKTLFMELHFTKDGLSCNSYTNTLAASPKTKPHMMLKGSATVQP